MRRTYSRRAFGLTTCLALWCAVLAGCAGLSSLSPDAIAIVGVTVVHAERDGAAALAPDSTVVIRGARIEAVGPAATTAVPANAQVIDAHGKWLIPGLIDSHVHFFQSGNLYTRPDAIDLNRQVPYAQEVARNQARLPATFKVWLASGVTGVVDVGGPFWNFDVRDLARKTDAAPRVAVAGPLISMVDDHKLDLGDPPIVKVESQAQARALTERELVRRPDYVKSWFIHGPNDDLAAQTALVKAAADAAHAGGVPFAVHATELEVAKAALRAGADFLVHSVEDEPADDEFIALMKARHALYCPTLFVTLGYEYALSGQWRATDAERRLADPQIVRTMDDLSRIPQDMLPARVVRRMQEKKPPQLSPVMAANLRRVWAEGIPVAMGTDAGNIGTLHGPAVFREMALMQEAGLTPLQVLRSATLNGARALRMEGELGVIAPKKLADLVILDANPLADLSALSHPVRVVKNGKVFDPAALIDSIR
jgi:imidazolonepropionase-like amidohydrolase